LHWFEQVFKLKSLFLYINCASIFTMLSIRHWPLLLVLLCGAGVWANNAWSADGLLDFSVLRPPAVQDRVIKEPIVTWLVQPDASSVATHCNKLTGFDGGSLWREGCVAWSVEGARCTMVTSKNTSHSLMGRLLTLCLLAGGAPS
jgi:hypothetical protein